MRILISGASGLIGSAVGEILRGRGDAVVALARSARGGAIGWADGAELDAGLLEGFDAIIHLAGEPIAGRWTAPKIRAIRASRVERTRQLAEAISRLHSPPRSFLCASAIGIYGSRGDEALYEESAPGSGFLAELCGEWEAASLPAVNVSNVAQLRFGLVLAADGGALGKMLPIFKLGLGGRLGDGKQIWSWITVADAARAVVHVLDGGLQGAFNLTAPGPVSNAEFTRVLGQVLRRPAVFPVPAFALRLAVNGFADEGLLSSARVMPRRLLKSGFVFEQENLKDALAAILAKR